MGIAAVGSAAAAADPPFSLFWVAPWSPTNGAHQPTLTVVMLALRLAEALRRYK
jgi:hypothetical protein